MIDGTWRRCRDHTPHHIGVVDEIDGAVGGAGTGVAVELNAIAVVGMVNREDGSVQESIVGIGESLDVRVGRPGHTRCAECDWPIDGLNAVA